MTQLSRKLVGFDVKWCIDERMAFLRRFFRFFWDKIIMCSTGKHIRYRRIPRFPSSRSMRITETVLAYDPMSMSSNGYETESDLVALKISLLGDCHIGKTSFMIKYVGDEPEKRCLEMGGLNLVEKISFVQGARIAYSIWDVGGDHKARDQIPIACKDASAILIMFDLTSRSTLNSVIGWYQQARKWNKTAIPILIGTKFDDFICLPLAMQWTIIIQARAYAQAMKATLFFSSSTYNINVNKIFKFITAKIFNLPWTVKRNLTIGEPIIDF
ncbi:hypothetical protein GIB67_035899 [Kingdonia uniflora]|uniref:Septum-promoting GTP-binding protein 1 n=1 Tax=Kingdonia uniflora TaxID=39325 RepID=A0A7J7P914_9MAGN|nr:hypothetical protein GIB67_035899 [Kingdonia uniflora]